MSTAHRPTWDPAQAKDVKGGSRQFSVRDMAAHTKLKFRFATFLHVPGLYIHVKLSRRQPGQTSAAEVAKRDLRAELLAAEAEARDKKRKAEGKPPLAVESGNGSATPTGELTADEESNKRRKLLQEALELDKDEDDDESESGNKDEEEEDECVLCLALLSHVTKADVSSAEMRTKMTKKTIRLNCCESLRKLSGNGQKRKSDKNGNRLPPRLLLERLR